MGTSIEALSSALWRSQGLSDGTAHVIDACIGLFGADAALIEIDDPDRGSWTQIAQRGLSPEIAALLDGGCREHPLIGPNLALGARICLPELRGPLDVPAMHAAGWVCCHASPLSGWNGELRGVLWTLFRRRWQREDDGLSALDAICSLAGDFIERCIADRAQAARESLLQTALADVNEAVVVRRRGGGPELFNDATFRMLGFPDRQSCERALGDPGFLEAMDMQWNPLQSHALPLQRLFDSGTVADARIRIRRRDTGLTISVSCRAMPVHDAEGTVVAGALIMHDITALEREERALRERGEALEQLVAERSRELALARDEAEKANRRKSQFLAAASHDLRQPLQAAMLHLGILREDLASEVQRETCRHIEAALGEMSGALDQILDYSRLHRGILQPRLEDFPAAQVLEPLLAIHAAEAERKGLGLSLEGEPGLGVRSDPVLLARIVSNLVANALRYTQEGSVRIGCGRADRDRVRISVRDTGVGIPAERLAEIFDAWVQLDESAGERRGGLGLGLAIVRGFALALGCTPGVVSEPGHGSCFWIDVPVALAT